MRKSTDWELGRVRRVQPAVNHNPYVLLASGTDAHGAALIRGSTDTVSAIIVSAYVRIDTTVQSMQLQEHQQKRRQ